jgi:hypothetical protein
MKRFALLAAFIGALALVGVAASAPKPVAPPIHAFVVVPSQYSSTVTPEQTVAAVQQWMGQPTDAPCIGSTTCTIEGWFRHELGKVFDYDVTVHYTPKTAAELSTTTDACGSMSSSLLDNAIRNLLYSEAGYVLNDQRTMMVVMGAGGWAAHQFTSPRGSTTGWGLVGDWGVMEQNGVPNSCVPSWDYPMRGFSHEVAGMMGMFSTSQGDSDDPIFTGDVLTTTEKRNINHNSGAWLRTP